MESIHGPEDVKALSADQLPALCEEIRRVMIQTVAQNGGHLASNLGTVELTVALHRVFDSPRDHLIFDVGHQCYTHKLLTGRYDRFATLRQEGGLSGFTRPDESDHDVFVSGHSSTSVSAALGLSVAGALENNSHYTVAVIGDGALTGGLAYEALNNAGRMKNTRLIVVLNDNKMSISRNVGAMARHLAVIRSRPGYFKAKTAFSAFLTKIPLIGKPLNRGLFALKTRIKNLLYNSTMFEDMGFAYLGPIDGHDLTALQNCMEMAKHMNRPALIHACTCKGKGYAFAEKTPKQYHGVAPGMDPDTGTCRPSAAGFSQTFGQTLCRLAADNPRLCAVTAAMCDGTGLSTFAKAFPERFFDVGIAEEHAVTFAAGLAKGGMLPVVAVYSAFLQRGYDQLIHDVAAQGLKVIVCVDRAGFVGEDGEMHQGLLDVAYSRSIPGATVYSPCNFMQLQHDLERAVEEDGSLILIRYPRGGEPATLAGVDLPAGNATALCHTPGASAAFVCYGRVSAACLAAARTMQSNGAAVDVIALNRIKPLPEHLLDLLAGYRHLFLVEEAYATGGLFQEILASLCIICYNGRVHTRNVAEEFVPQATVDRCLEQFGLDADHLAQWASDCLKGD